MEGIVDIGEALIGAKGGLVDLRRAFHGNGFVGPFGVELVQKVIEAGLLLKTVLAWRPRGFGLESSVHAFVTAILLGFSGLDALDGDAEPQPPDGQL